MIDAQTPVGANTNIMPTYEELLFREAQRNAGQVTTTPAFVQTPQVPRPEYQPEPSPAGFPQPQAHTHSAANAPQNPGHVPEALHVPMQNEVQINTNAESVNAVTLKLDGESMKILMDSNEIFRETIVNMGIKLASQTSVYRDYFRLSSLRLTSGNVSGCTGGVSSDYGVVDTPSVKTTEPISRVGSPLGNTYGNTEAEPKAPTTKKKPPGFGSWA